jgi:hypothetical protein
MCQAAMRRLLNHFESCQVRKVASLLTEALNKNLNIYRVQSVLAGYVLG